MAEAPLIEALLEPLRTTRRAYEDAHGVAVYLADGIDLLLGRVKGEQQSAIVCTVCGKVLSPGTMPPSHGLCEECAPRFMRP